MKKSILITTIAAVLASTLFFASCGAQIDKELYDQTIGKKTETTPPGNVQNLQVSVYTKAVTLHWENPTDKDFYGLTISASPAAGSLESPITYIADNREDIPTIFNVNNLPGNISYTFKIVTFDDNMNYSSGSMVTAKPEGDNSTATGKFFGTGEVFSYKMDKSAFDFGYCSEPTTKTIEILASDSIDTSETAFTNKNKLGEGNFELIQVEPKGTVKIDEKIRLTVKYTPSSNPSWDEMDILVGGLEDSKLTMIGSSFMQPKDCKVTDEKTGSEYGLKLWLRADMISSSDLTNNLVKRIPDYSGRGYHAYCTDTEYRFAPTYVQEDIDFNDFPGIDFDTNNATYRSQFLSMGTGEKPILDSSKGSTTFVVLKTPTESGNQTVIAANYGQSFPTLINTSRYYSDEGWNANAKYGWAVKGSGLYGTYRYPCTSNSTTDPDNTWFTNDLSTTTSMCMRYDQSLSPNATKNDDYVKDFPSNIRMQINGEERLLSFIYSNSTDIAKQPLGVKYNSSSTTSANCYGSYGKPISDGKGHRYGTLSGVQTPSTTEIARINKISTTVTPSDDQKHVYYHWYSDGRDPDSVNTEFKDFVTSDTTHFNSTDFLGIQLGRSFPASRKFDYSYGIQPYTYIGKDAKYIASTYQKSYASSDDGCPASAYYTNWISNESRRNGTVYSLIVGADNNIATYYRGKIAEVIMFDYPLSDEEIDIVNNYIYYRYKIGSVK